MILYEVMVAATEPAVVVVVVAVVKNFYEMISWLAISQPGVQ